MVWMWLMRLIVALDRGVPGGGRSPAEHIVSSTHRVRASLAKTDAGIQRAASRVDATDLHLGGLRHSDDGDRAYELRKNVSTARTRL